MQMPDEPNGVGVELVSPLAGSSITGPVSDPIGLIGGSCRPTEVPGVDTMTDAAGMCRLYSLHPNTVRQFADQAMCSLCAPVPIDHAIAGGLAA